MVGEGAKLQCLSFPRIYDLIRRFCVIINRTKFPSVPLTENILLTTVINLSPRKFLARRSRHGSCARREVRAPEGIHPWRYRLSLSQARSPSPIRFRSGHTIYEWEQDLEEVNIYINPPPGLPAKMIDCTISTLAQLYSHFTHSHTHTHTHFPDLQRTNQ